MSRHVDREHTYRGSSSARSFAIRAQRRPCIGRSWGSAFDWWLEYVTPGGIDRTYYPTRADARAALRLARAGVNPKG